VAVANQRGDVAAQRGCQLHGGCADSAAEHGSPTVGTVHLLSALLDESATDTRVGVGVGAVVAQLLAADQVDVDASRAELGLRLGA